MTRRQGTDLTLSLQRVVLAPVSHLCVATQVIVMIPDRVVRVPTAIDHVVHVGRHVGTRVMLLLLIFVDRTVLALGAAPRVRRIKSVLSWKEEKKRIY